MRLVQINKAPYGLRYCPVCKKVYFNAENDDCLTPGQEKENEDSICYSQE